MEEKILRPQRNKLEIKGKLSYIESTHSWSLMNLRKPVIEEFPQLKERASKFGYKMTFCREYEELEKFLRKLKKDSDIQLARLVIPQSALTKGITNNGSKRRAYFFMLPPKI